MYAQHLCVASLKAIRESLLQSGCINLKCGTHFSQCRRVFVPFCILARLHTIVTKSPALLMTMSNVNAIKLEPHPVRMGMRPNGNGYTKFNYACSVENSVGGVLVLWYWYSADLERINPPAKLPEYCAPNCFLFKIL